MKFTTSVIIDGSTDHLSDTITLFENIISDFLNGREYGESVVTLNVDLKILSEGLFSNHPKFRVRYITDKTVKHDFGELVIRKELVIPITLSAKSVSKMTAPNFLTCLCTKLLNELNRMKSPKKATSFDRMRLYTDLRDHLDIHQT